MQKLIEAENNGLTKIVGKATGKYDIVDYQVFNSSKSHYDAEFCDYDGLRYDINKSYNVDIKDYITFKGTKLPYKEEFSTQLQIEDYALAPIGQNYDTETKGGQVVSLPGCLYNVEITPQTHEVNCFADADRRIVLTLEDHYQNWRFLDKVDLTNVVFKDTDYVVFAYHYNVGHHLDTFTRLTNSNNDNYNIAVGFYANINGSTKNYKIPEYGAGFDENQAPPIDSNALVQWARHNRGTYEDRGLREENIVINVDNFNDPQYDGIFGDVITFDLYCAFLGRVTGVTSPHDVQIIIRGYKGGTMAPDPNDWYRYINVDENGHENEPKYYKEVPLENLYIAGTVGDWILGNSNGYKHVPEDYSAESRNKLRKGVRVHLNRITKTFTFEIIQPQE